ncbi:hypothetical protein GAYE_SCF02G2160 [Galdieria yellowstonensis]|uniref:Uncharacterized protein n=1 Tax=Galdieria yellowstonensis TaxID=3028027 RepID=A0AAV9IAJ2_9RHOD|nr:hypothetical protein GAYE_SCF02G2160 [Galdieria yellowstonensis]
MSISGKKSILLPNHLNVEKPPCCPSLKTICLHWIARNTARVGELGDVPDELMYKVGCLCGAKDLARLEDNNPGREAVFEALWAALLKRDFSREEGNESHHHHHHVASSSRERYQEEDEKRKRCLYLARAKLEERYELATLEKQQHRVATMRMSRTSRNHGGPCNYATNNNNNNTLRRKKSGMHNNSLLGRRKKSNILEKLKWEARHQLLYSRVAAAARYKNKVS